MITLLILSILSLIPHSNSQCPDSEPLTAQCSSSNTECSNPTTTDGMTISLTLCSDNFIYMQITYTQFNNKWFGIRFPNLPLTGSKMHGNAVVYTDDGGEGLYSYTIGASNLAGVVKDTTQFWTEVSTDKTTDLTIIYKISIADATTHYNWDLNTNSVAIYYVLANPSASLTLSTGTPTGHGSATSSTELTLNFPHPTTTDTINSTPEHTTGTVDTEISVADIIALRDNLSAKFTAQGSLAPSAGNIVRLAFHDCAGSPETATPGVVSICDGCIGFESNDHKGFNGNGQVVDFLEEIFLNEGPTGVNDNTKWTDKMSLADFWMAAATVAIIHTHENSGKDTLPTIPFYFGRSECSTSPVVNGTNSPIKDLPDAIVGWSDIDTWFDINMDMSAEEIVALLGAHTIGIKHVAASGMSGFWVSAWGTFDNQFYIDLINKDWQQEDNSQWDASGASMLNVDIGLLKHIEPDLNLTNGEVSCLFNECPDNNDTASIVRLYASDNALWLDAFVNAWIKMITIGYNVTELDEIIINIEETTTQFPIPGMSTTDGITTTKDDGKFDAIEWAKENWYFVVGGVVVLILICILCMCCCKRTQQRKRKREQNLEMFGHTAV